MRLNNRLIPYVSLLILYGWLSVPAWGQISFGGVPWAQKAELNTPWLHDVSDHEHIASILEKVDDGFGPMRAGVGIPLNMELTAREFRTIIDHERVVWRMQIRAEGAMALGLVFSHFNLAEDATLFVYNEDASFVLGAFTAGNNNDWQVFSTHIIPGSNLVIELSEPYGPSMGRPLSSLSLGELIYVDQGSGLWLFEEEKGLGSSGDCHVNINCPEGNLWQRQKRGVARILLREGSAWYWCTGSLMNNTREDGSPLFLTSDHCGDASSDADLAVWQFYFNYERPGCDNTGVLPNHMLTGATFRSKGLLSGGTDLKLLELHSTPPESYMPYYNGWSRSTTGSPSGVGIHHPRGDAKKISTYTTNLISANWNSGTSGMNQGFWRVSWAPTESGHGVTEGGSSGSPIFDHQGMIVGTLTGGASSCGGPAGPDFYGKFDRHWAANGTTPNRQLRPWLDPLGQDPEYLRGYDPYGNPYDPPLNLNATVEDDEVTLNWMAPGTAANPEGWVTYNTELTHLSWESPQRATLFRASDFTFSYPALVSRLAHFFYEHSTQTWPDDKFRFFIYDVNGETILYESEVLVAERGKQYTHIMENALEVTSDFYVAVAPVDNSGHPSSGMKLMEGVNSVNSYVGSPGNWTQYVIDGSYYELYTLVYITAAKTSVQDVSREHKIEYRKNPAGEKSEGLWLKALPVNPHTVETVIKAGDSLPVQSLNSLRSDGEAQLSGYRIYRNDELLTTLEDASQLTYTDTGLDPGDYTYYVTAIYDDDGESDESNMVFVSIAEPEVYYKVGFAVSDQQGTPLEQVKITLTPYVQETEELFYENWSGYDDFTTNLSPWKTLDPLGIPTYSSQTFEFPGQTQPFAFMAFNPAETSPPANHPPIDGDKYAIAISSAHSPTRDEDKWLISPPVLLEGASSLSFYARSITASYGLERIRVLVSTGGNEREDFEHELTPDPYIEIPVNWTELTFDLSQFDGQEIHIAIHYVSHDAFILMLDAIRIAGVSAKDDATLVFETDADGLASAELLPGMYQYRMEKSDHAGIRKVFTVSDKDLVIEEQMTTPAYTLTLVADPADGGLVLDLTDSNPYAEGAEVLVESIPSEKFVFIGWSDGGEKDYLSTDLEFTYTMGAVNKVLTAHFERDETSLAQPGPISSLLAYPNPASSSLHIEMTDQQPMESILIFNLMGQLVSKTQPGSRSSVTLDTSHLDNGLYVLQVITQQQTHTKRIQVRR